MTAIARQFPTKEDYITDLDGDVLLPLGRLKHVIITTYSWWQIFKPQAKMDVTIEYAIDVMERNNHGGLTPVTSRYTHTWVTLGKYAKLRRQMEHIEVQVEFYQEAERKAQAYKLAAKQYLSAWPDDWSAEELASMLRKASLDSEFALKCEDISVFSAALIAADTDGEKNPLAWVTDRIDDLASEIYEYGRGVLRNKS